MRLKGRWPHNCSKIPFIDGEVWIAARCGRRIQAAGEPCIAAVATDVEGVGLGVWVAVKKREGVNVADFAFIHFFGAR